MRSSILAGKRARTLRSAMSEPEVMLWSRLRKRLGDGLVFRRQHPMGSYILDFYCPAAKLAVEIDGRGHDVPRQMAHDAARDGWLASHGVRVMRVAATEVLADLSASELAVRRLAAELLGAGAAPSVRPSAGPATSPARGGGSASATTSAVNRGETE